MGIYMKKVEASDSVRVLVPGSGEEECCRPAGAAVYQLLGIRARGRLVLWEQPMLILLHCRAVPGSVPNLPVRTGSWWMEEAPRVARRRGTSPECLSLNPYP